MQRLNIGAWGVVFPVAPSCPQPPTFVFFGQNLLSSPNPCPRSNFLGDAYSVLSFRSVYILLGTYDYLLLGKLYLISLLPAEANIKSNSSTEAALRIDQRYHGAPRHNAHSTSFTAGPHSPSCCRSVVTDCHSKIVSRFEREASFTSPGLFFAAGTHTRQRSRSRVRLSREPGRKLSAR